MIVLLALAVLSGALSGIFCRVKVVILISLIGVALHAVAALAWGWPPASAVLTVLAVQVGFILALVLGALNVAKAETAEPVAEPVRHGQARRTPNGLRS